MGNVVKGIVGFFQGKKKEKEAKQKEREAKKLYEQQKSAYQNVDTGNPFEGLINQYASLTNQYAGLENVMEDLTINQQQAEFERAQQEQQRANIMDRLSGAAGGSGIAALAQQMANQGSLQARQAAASIGQQEAANQKLQAQGELIVQRGEQAAQEKRVQGDIMSRQWEKERIQTLMGMGQQETAAHNLAAAQARAQQTEAWGDIASGVGSATTGGIDAGYISKG